MDRGADGGQRRSEAEERPGEERDQQREPEHANIEVDLGQAWKPVPGQPEHRAGPEQREHDAEGTAEDTEDHALREQLLHDPATPGAERCPDRELPGPPAGAGEHEIRHVHAGDEQHERHRGEEEEEDRAD